MFSNCLCEGPSSRSCHPCEKGVPHILAIYLAEWLFSPSHFKLKVKIYSVPTSCPYIYVTVKAAPFCSLSPCPLSQLNRPIFTVTPKHTIMALWLLAWCSHCTVPSVNDSHDRFMLRQSSGYSVLSAVSVKSEFPRVLLCDRCVLPQ